MTESTRPIETITCSNCPNPFINELVCQNDFKERCPRKGTETQERKLWEVTLRNAGTCALYKLMAKPEPLT